MGKVKVLHFELSNQVGGIESFLLNVYSNIDRDKIQFDFVTISEEPALGAQFKELGGKIYEVSNYRCLSNYKKDISQLIEFSDYDVVHFHKNSAANIIPMKIVSKAKNRPLIIVHSHNTSPSVGRVTQILHYLNRKKMYELADYHFACSREAAKWMYNDSCQKDVCIIPNGIETKKFFYTKKKAVKKRLELGIDDDVFVLGHIGRFSEQKNHELLLKIFQSILMIKPKSILLLIGTGNLKEEIEREVSLLGIKDKVWFLGTRTDIPELLFAMDAFIMPSLYEGLPIAAVEAQAAGLQVYLSNKISRESELSNGVSWFSLEENCDEIARKVVEESYKATEEIRQSRNMILSQSQYNIKTTATVLESIYLKAKEKRMPNEKD